MTERRGIDRRTFLAAGAAGAAFTLTDQRLAVAAGAVPTRPLGRTGVRVSSIGFGSAPLGHSFQAQKVFDEVLGVALDLGITYIDTATIYDVAQERLGSIVKRERKRMFLVTKTRGMSRGGVLKTLEESLRLLQTDHVDLVHLHNIADFDVERFGDADSALAGLLEAKKRGWLRFLGCSGHQVAAKMAAAIDTKAFDVIMAPVNFVDQHTYAYQSKVLPMARDRRMGIAAMKVLGGKPGFQYRVPGPALMPSEHVERAIRYSLGVPGVSTAVIGFNYAEQVRTAAAIARDAKPLTTAELEDLSTKGRALAGSWGLHMGPA